MNLVIVGKNPFFYKEKGYYLAGHTVGFIYQFINFLIKKKHKIVFISPNEKKDSPHWVHKEFMPPFPKNPNFSHIFIEPKKLEKVPFVFPELDVQAALLEAKKRLGGMDYVLSIYIFPWIAPINALKRRLNYKTAAFLRGTDVTKGCNPNSAYRKIYGNKWPHIAQLMRIFINQSEIIYTTSQWLKDFSRHLGIQAQCVSPTPPFTISNDFKKVAQGSIKIKKQFLKYKVIKKQIGYISAKKPWLIYLGRFHKEKNVDLAINSFCVSKYRQNAHLILGGEGPQLAFLKQKIKNLRVKNISFCFVPPDLVPLFCKSAIAMIHTWKFPNTVIDARPSSCTNASSVGCPVIVPFAKDKKDFGGAHESLSKLNIAKLSYNPFLPESAIISQICKNIELVIENQSLREEISRANIRWCVKFRKDTLFNEIENRLKKS